MGGAITGDRERTEEEKEGDPPHLRSLQLFSRGCAYDEYRPVLSIDWLQRNNGG